MVRSLLRWLVVAGMAVLLIVLGYDTLRIENARVQWLFAGLFALFAGFIALAGNKSRAKWIGIFASGLLLRLVLMGSTPQLSDDYFRYTWDGHLNSMHIDPYEYTPNQYILAFPDDTVARDIMEANSDGLRLNSRRFYSVYPTVYQAIFTVADALNGPPNKGSLWIIRGILLLFELLTFWILLRLIRSRGISDNRVALYWLNPLVIVELTGNLHFDGIGIFFLLLSFYYVSRERILPSAVALALGVATKLNPLFLVCVAWREWQWKRWLIWGALTGVCSIALMAVYLDMHNIYHVKWSYRLYLYAFHFNSSLLNAIRGIGGPGAMEVAMGIFPKLIFLLILALNFLKKKWGLSERVLLAYSIYYFLGTTIHPWYVIVLLPFAILSNWKFPHVWTYLVVWTYSFYHAEMVRQIGWVVGLEYGLLAVVVYLDLIAFQRRTASVQP